MAHLSGGDYQALLDSLRKLYAHCRLSEFPGRAIVVLRELIPCDGVNYSEINPRRNRDVAVADPSSDFFARPGLHDHRLYREVMEQMVSRPRGSGVPPAAPPHRRDARATEKHRPGPAGSPAIGDRLSATLPAPPDIIVAFTLNRTRSDFTARDRTLLELLTPHLAQAYRNAERVTEQEHGAHPKPPSPSQAGSRDTTQATVADLHLTPREHEILRWVAEGKSNPEIAIILGCSPRTVQKHLEHVYDKLGVENRTTAALRAIDILNRKP